MVVLSSTLQFLIYFTDNIIWEYNLDAIVIIHLIDAIAWFLNNCVNQ